MLPRRRSRERYEQWPEPPRPTYSAAPSTWTAAFSGSGQKIDDVGAIYVRKLMWRSQRDFSPVTYVTMPEGQSLQRLVHASAFSIVHTGYFQNPTYFAGLVGTAFYVCHGPGTVSPATSNGEMVAEFGYGDHDLDVAIPGGNRVFVQINFESLANYHSPVGSDFVGEMASVTLTFERAGVE